MKGLPSPYEKKTMKVFENTDGIFGTKKEQISRVCRNVHNEELQNVCFSSNITVVTKSRALGWARMVTWRNAFRISVENLKGRGHLKDLRR
jgi:hypothetical protein